jgi:hypothetical protein
MALQDLLRGDRHVRKLSRMLQGGDYSINTVEFVRELEGLHATRLTRRLKVTDVTQRFQGRFMRAVLQNQATRSRAVEIKMRCFRTQAKLQRHLDDLTKYLMATYAEQLRRAASTKGERENIIKSCYGNATVLLEEMSSAMAIGDLMIADLDQSGWALKHLVDMMQLITEKGKQY